VRRESISAAQEMIIALNRNSAQSDNKRAAARNLESRISNLESRIKIDIIKTAFAPAE
jgi:hypothetical protein